MNEHGKRRVGFCALAGKQVDGLARRGAVGDAQFRARRRSSIGIGLALPAREDFRMLRHAGAVVVLFFVIDGHFRNSAFKSRRRLAYAARRSKRGAGIGEMR
jgi:hypothetical protein